MEQKISNENSLINEIIELKDKINDLSSELESLDRGRNLIENYYELFDSLDISLSEFDVTELREENKRLKENNIKIEDYLLNKKNLKQHASFLKLKRINRGTVKLFEAENEEDLKKNFFKISTNKSMKGIKDRQIAFFNEENYFEEENTYQTLKGKEIHVLEKIYFPPSKSNAVIISLQDMSKNKLLESELKSNKEKYRFLFEHSPVMIIEYNLSKVYEYFKSLNLANTTEFKDLLMDRSTGVLEEAFKQLLITDVNDTSVNLLKAPNKKDIMEHFDHYYTENTFNAYLENIVLVFDGVLERQFETELVTSEGEHIDVLITWQIVPGYEKDYSKIFLILVDITKQKEMNNHLIEMQKLDSLGLLAGGIAHDLNNLLSPILGRINIIQSSFEGNKEAQEQLKRMEETTLSASELVRQLLTYSGKGKFVTGTCNLNDVLNKTKYLINVTATKKVEIIYKLAKSLPDIEADENQIQQMVMNLVSNAASASKYSGKLIIETKSKILDETELQQSYKKFRLQHGEYVILKITDKGKGIEESISDKIFDPFFSTKSSGRGLGLSVVLGIVKTHKGGIQFDSEVGKGTTFTVIFPKNLESLNENTVLDKKITEKTFNKFSKVVVCDDEPSVLEITSLMLKKLGLKVFEAASGLECIEIFKEENIDLIFTDLTMPNMDGVTVIKEIRKTDGNIPIILMSGYNKNEIELQLTGFNINGFLQKPFTLDSIKEKLSSILV